ncbi:MAG: hypothetical protein M3Y56_04840, partial [Armatimonadota bacterium]|nr:hypothetical protein [Armatimonadota bacterium]
MRYPLFPLLILSIPLLVGVAPSCAQAPPTAPTGLPPAIMQEVHPDGSLPSGRYTAVATWSGAGPGEGHQTGQAVPDPQAAGPQVWEAKVGRDKSSTHMVFGPYRDAPAGDYVAFFRLKLLDDAGEETVGTLDASIGGGQQVLAVRELTGSQLSLNQYVQAPLAFHSPGGKLECRVFWTGYSGLRLDQVSLFRLEGGLPSAGTPRAPAPTPSGLPKNLTYYTEPRPFPEIFPQSKPPAANMTVIDLSRLPPDWQLCMFTLQGIVNRRQPRIYAIFNPTDEFWLQRMLQKHTIRTIRRVDTPQQLIALFRSDVKGVVVTDPSLPASKNVATMIASVDNGIVVSPRMAAQLAFPVLDDLRRRWTTSAAAYRWAFDHLWDRLNHHVIACSYPSHLALRDYLVENKVFIFWVSGQIDGAKPYASPTAEMHLMEELLAKMPVNIPVMSYPWASVDVGMGEGPGVSLFAEFGKYLVGSIDCSNLSVHSGIRPRDFQQQKAPPPPPLQRDKVYYSFIMSDGDNLPVLTVNNFPELWKDPLRGKFPIGWSISPSASMLIPDVVDYYYSTATKNDLFLGAVSGIGYTYPDLYGDRYLKPDQTRIFNEFLGQTSTYMNRMDLKDLWLMNVTRPALFQAYAENIPSLEAMFPDYGRRVGSYREADELTARNVPVFHAINGWQDPATKAEQIDHIVNEVRSMTPPERPAFMHLFLWNWGMDLPTLQAIRDRLGPDYIDVRPDHLASLFHQRLKEEGLRVDAPESVVSLGGQPAPFTVRVNNLSGRTLNIGASATAASLIPEQFKLAPDESRTVQGSAPPGSGPIHLDFESEMGAKGVAIGHRDVSKAETVGPLPPLDQLRAIGHWEAERMSHGSGKLTPDPTASAGQVWTAIPGDTKPGVIVYGPYVNLPAGQYLA